MSTGLLWVCIYFVLLLVLFKESNLNTSLTTDWQAWGKEGSESEIWWVLKEIYSSGGDWDWTTWCRPTKHLSNFLYALQRTVRVAVQCAAATNPLHSDKGFNLWRSAANVQISILLFLSPQCIFPCTTPIVLLVLFLHLPVCVTKGLQYFSPQRVSKHTARAKVLCYLQSPEVQKNCFQSCLPSDHLTVL